MAKENAMEKDIKLVLNKCSCWLIMLLRFDKLTAIFPNNAVKEF